jgi:hypothetical protein
MTGVALDVGCHATTFETDVHWEGATLVESVRLSVQSDGGCGGLTVDLPPTAEWAGGSGRIRVVDARDVALAGRRWSPEPVDARGHESVRLHLEDLSADDTARVEFVRRWQGGFTWEAAGARWSGLSGAGAVDVPAPLRRDRTGLVWVEAPQADARLVVGTPASLDPAAEAAPRNVARALVLSAPPGDAQQRLFPGGGSTFTTDLRLEWAPDEGVARRAWIPLPPAAAFGEPTVQPASAARVQRWSPGRVRVDLPAGEAPIHVALRWTQPDAPVHGTKRSGEDLLVRAEDGTVIWDGPDTWALTSLHGTDVLPGREALVAGLGWRFFVASLPEPGAPLALRGRPRDLALANALLPELWKRAVVVPELPGDPLHPLKLRRALRSRLVTPLEAALVLAAWARQLGLDAVAIPVAPLGVPAGAVGAAGFEDALVRVVVGSELLWLDPACRACGPGEIRPELGGTPVLGPDGPAIASGTSRVRVDGDLVDWALTGAAALELRLDLEGVASERRGAWLAERLAGHGASLLSASGIPDAGSDIELRVRCGAGPVYDPTNVDPNAPVTWHGTRSFEGPDGVRLATPTRPEP